MGKDDLSTGGLPRATYRLQLHPGFTFSDAVALIPHLQKLGISHIYCSPIFAAPKGSMHGYDVCDPGVINPHLGGEAGFKNFARAARQAGLGLLLDFVPNHMGIGDESNCWWRDVLRNGPRSKFAKYFDIHWPEGIETPQLVLPTLGDFCQRVVEKGELQVVERGGEFLLQYYDQTFPINAAGAEWLQKEKRSAGKLPVKEFLSRLNARPGDPRSTESMLKLLSLQFYRLMYWRQGIHVLNYRRFFEVNSLAGIRIEDPEVFAAVHTKARELIGAGLVAGLRIDHIDGLLNPREYLDRLQSLASPHPDLLPKGEGTEVWGPLAKGEGREMGAGSKAEERKKTSDPKNLSLFVVVEKILAEDEALPEWPVHGTTGYEFAASALGLFIDSGEEKQWTRLYESFTGRRSSFAEITAQKKEVVLRRYFVAELNRLAAQASRAAESSSMWRDLSAESIREALIAYISHLPVYRTYLEPGRAIEAREKRIIAETIATARDKTPGFARDGLEFLRNALERDSSLEVDGEGRETSAKNLDFIFNLQQLTGAVMAKGVEDTSFYVYNRLFALNEVGGNPGRFGESLSAFHAKNSHRLAHYPGCLLATSTHDTKTSEDVRARLAVLSEMPGEWEELFEAGQRLNDRFKQTVAGRPAPDPNEEWFLYQMLLGVWPLTPLDQTGREELAKRLESCVLKASREAKQNTSWHDPNPEWEAALSHFAPSIVGLSPESEFMRKFRRVQSKLAAHGAINSLSQTLLKLTSPGIPDFYQGTEVWFLALVDPDNRRPIDYKQRKALLRQAGKLSPRELMRDWKTGAIKTFLISRTLAFRAQFPDLFRAGTYDPLKAQGTKAEHVIAFRRGDPASGFYMVVVPRRTVRLRFPALSKSWEDTYVETPSGVWRDIYTGRRIRAVDDKMPLRRVFAELPFALLQWEPEQSA